MNQLEVNKPNNHPRIIVGSSDFKKLRLNNAIIVDKSLLIKAILEAPSEVSLIARPRRWGKSLNLRMLKYFFEIETDARGQPLPLTERSNQKLFTGLKISADQDSMVEQGQYPVIFLSLKNTKGNDYQEIENNIKKKIQKSFEQHTYLVNSSQLRLDEKELFQNYLQGKINKTELKDSLCFLSELLTKHFQEKVFVLIDEYDETINSSYVKFGQKPEEFNQVIDLIREILGSVLKDNPCLEKGILTGIYRIAKVNLFSDLNNMAEYTLFDKRFGEHYGFMQNEVDDLLTRIPDIVDPNDIKEWYNGYNFGEQTVYNPLSIMRCLSEGGALSAYWMDSGSTELIEQALLSDEIQASLQDLLVGEKVIKQLHKQISFEQIKENEDALYSLLVFAGYLNPTLTELVDVYELSIPNQEVKQIYEDRVIQWVTRKLDIGISKYYSLVQLLLKKKILEFVEQIKEFLLEATSFLQTGKKQGELFYSGFMIGLMNSLKPIYHFNSEPESGKGRADLILIPKTDRHNHAFIIEYKFCDKKKAEDLNSAAETGLKQIKEKKYNVKVRPHPHVKEIFNLSLAFCGKEVAAKCEVEEKISEQNWQTRILI